MSVIYADVDGDGKTDTVILYATLTRRRYGTRYLPRALWLVVRRPGAGQLPTRLPRSGSNPFFLQHGNLDGVAGAELTVQVQRISSGSTAVIYTDAAGRLQREPVALEFGGDSAIQAGFACRTGAVPEVIQHAYELDGSRERSRWRDTTTVYGWQGAILRPIALQVTNQPTVVAKATALSRSCGTFDASSD